ncbi:Biotin-lipoyl like [Acetitomaculum ruminis DSM 5522]|uniref:Biotin-lipoyl like n=1 Tax=Acetitomaculum ruminis DSM 5522 TaxID=1120918 RepID=A0A1I0Z6R5_9FIRM|nr:biotin/lipoyl-binding protein [Acetitomaculum ruminis]SFB20270.1 Biotin-lipoyl like [Acetitomaculum ruminis DSM 5522]
MEKGKKILKAVIITLIIIALIGGGVGYYINYSNQQLVAKVMSVSNLGYEDYESSGTTTGSIKSNKSQSIYLDDDMTLKEVNVKQGDTVKAGDVLLTYESEMLQINVQEKQLQITNTATQIKNKEAELQKFKTMTPVTPKEPEPDTPDNPDTPDDNDDIAGKVENPEKVVAIGTVNAISQSYYGDGSSKNPYRFLCTEDGYVTGELFNTLGGYNDEGEQVNDGKYAVFEIREGDVLTGTKLENTTIDGSMLPYMKKKDKVSVKLLTTMVTEAVIDEPEEEPDNEPEEEPQEEGYTQQDINDKINSINSELRQLNLAQKENQVDLETAQKELDKANVKAEMDGIVVTCGNMDELPSSDRPMIVISDAAGMYVTGTVSEFDYNDLKVGQVISGNTWETGTYFTAKITDISTYPSNSNDNDYYGPGNSNTSYYPFTAYIEDASGLNNGEGADITLKNNEGNKGFYLPKAYVRKDGNTYYCFVRNDEGVLEKRKVSVGQSSDSYYVKIYSGITMDDYVAFPYGDTAKEGVKCEEYSYDMDF